MKMSDEASHIVAAAVVLLSCFSGLSI
jgi:hypothetical protein